MSKGVTPLVEETKAYVFKLFRDKLPGDLIYHDFLHTYETAQAAQEICKGLKLKEEDRETVLLAAYLHDIGYIKTYQGHEAAGIEMAEEYLRSKNYPEDKIEQVSGCIRATRMPQTPTNLLEEILCDADLSNLAMENQQERSLLLRMEQESRGLVSSDKTDWLKIEMEFIASHRYFTTYAQVKWNNRKYKNLLRAKKDIDRDKRKNQESNDKISLKERDLERKEKKDLLPDRGIETMFRTASRTHINLSAIADNKANIMLSVNAVIISVVISGLASKLDTNRMLLYPTIILLTSCVVSIIFATLSTRPKITEGKFRRKDIEERTTNLLFFGNFYNMELKDFEWGMNAMMRDKSFLYGSLTRDLYYLGVVLAKKYKYLRFTYTIFMYGLILSTIAFAVTFLAMPDVVSP